MTRPRAALVIGAVCAVFAAPSLASAGGPSVVTHETTIDYGFSGTAERFRAPIGVDSVEVMACGAEGGTGVPVGDGFDIVFARAGLGAEVAGEITVSHWQKLNVRVGGQGGEVAGFNGGGTSVFDPLFQVEGQGGGGASDVRVGGNTLRSRAIVAGGGGGGGGGFVPLFPDPSVLVGGHGGFVGGDAPDSAGGKGGTQTAGGVGGIGSFGPGSPGTLGRGGDAASGTGAGGGGLYGGGGGSIPIGYGGGGGGGSSLAATVVDGVCAGDGWVKVSFVQPLSVRPAAALVVEADGGVRTVAIPVHLSAAAETTVTANWSTVDGLSSPGLATSGADFVSASGVVTFDPGETLAYIEVDVLGDTDVEPDLLWGEWGMVQLSQVSGNALLETGPFFGAGLFIIEDND